MIFDKKKLSFFFVNCVRGGWKGILPSVVPHDCSMFTLDSRKKIFSPFVVVLLACVVVVASALVQQL